MKWQFVLSTILIGIFSSTSVPAQRRPDPLQVKSESVAYRALLQQKSGIELRLQQLYRVVTATHPKIVLEKARLKSLQEEIAYINNHAIPVEKLDEVFGRLAIRRAFLKADLEMLRRDFTSDHPSVVAKCHELDCLADEFTRLGLDQIP
jgi:hypothetical protein